VIFWIERNNSFKVAVVEVNEMINKVVVTAAAVSFLKDNHTTTPTSMDSHEVVPVLVKPCDAFHHDSTIVA
jgi:hypothetical protein